MKDQVTQAFDKGLLETEANEIAGMVAHVHNMLIIEDQVLAFDAC